MAIVFPASPSVNDTFTVGSITYKCVQNNPTQWIGLGVTPADRLIEGSNSLELDANNDLIYTAPGTLKVNSADASGYIAEFNQTNASNSGQILLNSPTDGNSRPSLVDFARGGTVKFSVGMGYNDANDGFLVSAGGSLASNITNAVFRITPDGKTGIGNYAANGTVTPTSLLEVATNWDNGDVPMVHFIGANNEAPQSGTQNISFQISDENSNVLHKVWNTGGGNNDLGNVYYAGKVGIGQTEPQGNLHLGTETGSNQNIVIHTANNGGARIRFREGGSLTTGFNEYSFGMVGNANKMSFEAQGQGEVAAVTDNGIAFPSGKGIDFSATANSSGTMTSELLDDYEEGAFTPSILGTTTNPSYTVDTNRSQYTKIGRLVDCTIDMSITGLTGGSGQVYVTLPFNAQNNMPKPYAELIAGRNNTWFNGANNTLFGWTVENSNAAYVVYQSGNSGAETVVNWGTNTNTGSVRFCLHYLYYTDT